MKYLIRFNTKHAGSGLVWRVLENGTEHLVRGLNITVPVRDEVTVEDNVAKWNIACDGDMYITDGIAVIQ